MFKTKVTYNMSVRVFFRNGALVANGIRAIVASVEAIHVARTVVDTVVRFSDAKRFANSIRFTFGQSVWFMISLLAIEMI